MNAGESLQLDVRMDGLENGKAPRKRCKMLLDGRRQVWRKSGGEDFD